MSIIWVYLQVTFVDDEHLIGITGNVGVYEGYTVIRSMSFHTNKKNYGPYGTNQGTSFSLPVAKGSFGGFSGNYGAYIDSFSVILQSSSFGSIITSNVVYSFTILSSIRFVIYLVYFIC